MSRWSGWLLCLACWLTVRGSASATTPEHNTTSVSPPSPAFVLFEGNDHYDDETLRNALALDTNPLASHAEQQARLCSFYLERGFLDAEVEILDHRDPITGTDTRLIHVREHTQVRVEHRTYPGFPTQELQGVKQGPRTIQELNVFLDKAMEGALPRTLLWSAPEERMVDAWTRGGETPHGTYAPEITLDPAQTYVPNVYKMALTKLETQYRAEGFLDAEVGPLQVFRTPCAPHSSSARCFPIPFPNTTQEASSLEGPTPCTPGKGRICADTLTLSIPIRLGPRAILEDLWFEGVQSIPEPRLAETGDLRVGKAIGQSALEAAAQRILALYRQEGYLFASVHPRLEVSLDRAHAQAVFQVEERKRVKVHKIVLRGNRRTPAALILSRVALEVGKPYLAVDVETTRRDLARLGSFASIDIALENPDTETEKKTVLLTVVEQSSLFVEGKLGFSTGNGVKAGVELGMFHLLHRAVQPMLQLELGYLPPALIYDSLFREQLKTRFGEPGLSNRLVVRALSHLLFPDIGLGPRAQGEVNFSWIRDLQRQFAIRKLTVGTTVQYIQQPTLRYSFGGTVEHNEVILLGGALETTILDAALRRLVRVPSGKSVVFAQKITLGWDQRDQPLAPRRGFALSAGAEHVDAYPLPGPADNEHTFEGHSLKLTQTISGYLPLTKRITLTAQLRTGQIVQLTEHSKTYPDRLFFLGGADSMRGYLPETLIPQDVMDRLSTAQEHEKAKQVLVKGGNWMINPRAELLVDVHDPFLLTLFVDAGNVWVEPSTSHFRLQVAGGGGLRVRTPLGPIGLDYGINLTRRASEAFGALNITLGML